MRGVVPIHPFSYSDDKFSKVIFKFVLETKTVAQRAYSAVEMHEIKLELKSTSTLAGYKWTQNLAIFSPVK
jgi:hypothetical protein